MPLTNILGFGGRSQILRWNPTTGTRVGSYPGWVPGSNPNGEEAMTRRTFTPLMVANRGGTEVILAHYEENSIIHKFGFAPLGIIPSASATAMLSVWDSYYSVGGDYKTPVGTADAMASAFLSACVPELQYGSVRTACSDGFITLNAATMAKISEVVFGTAQSANESTMRFDPLKIPTDYYYIVSRELDRGETFTDIREFLGLETNDEMLQRWLRQCSGYQSHTIWVPWLTTGPHTWAYVGSGTLYPLPPFDPVWSQLWVVYNAYGEAEVIGKNLNLFSNANHGWFTLVGGNYVSYWDLPALNGINKICFMSVIQHRSPMTQTWRAMGGWDPYNVVSDGERVFMLPVQKNILQSAQSIAYISTNKKVVAAHSLDTLSQSWTYEFTSFAGVNLNAPPRGLVASGKLFVFINGTAYKFDAALGTLEGQVAITGASAWTTAEMVSDSTGLYVSGNTGLYKIA